MWWSSGVLYLPLYLGHKSVFISLQFFLTTKPLRMGSFGQKMAPGYSEREQGLT